MGTPLRDACNLPLYLFFAPLPQARRAGGEHFAGSPVATCADSHAVTDLRGIETFRPGHGKLAITPLRSAGRLLQPVPRQGQALLCSTFLGRQERTCA
jgi:hypothetical protein